MNEMLDKHMKRKLFKKYHFVMIMILLVTLSLVIYMNNRVDETDTRSLIMYNDMLYKYDSYVLPVKVSDLDKELGTILKRRPSKVFGLPKSNFTSNVEKEGSRLYSLKKYSIEDMIAVYNQNGYAIYVSEAYTNKTSPKIFESMDNLVFDIEEMIEKDQLIYSITLKNDTGFKLHDLTISMTCSLANGHSRTFIFQNNIQLLREEVNTVIRTIPLTYLSGTEAPQLRLGCYVHVPLEENHFTRSGDLEYFDQGFISVKQTDMYVQLKIEEALNEIMTPGVSSNPQDYIDQHLEAYDYIISQGDIAFDYLIEELDKSQYRDLRMHIMAIIASNLNDEVEGYGLEWYENYKNRDRE